MSSTRILRDFFLSDTTQAVTSVTHSVSINMQNIEAHIVPIGVASIVSALDIIQNGWVPIKTSAELVTRLHSLVTPGYIYQHLPSLGIPHLPAVASAVLPAAAILDGVCRTAIGISKITFWTKYRLYNKEVPWIDYEEEHRDFLTDASTALARKGLYETLCGLTTTSLGIYALAVASAPVACLTFAITNYLDVLPMLLLGSRNRVAACFKFIEATGFLLCAFGMPLGGLLLAASAIHKIWAPALTGNLKNNISQDVHRFNMWRDHNKFYSKFSYYPTNINTKLDMQRIGLRQVR